MGNISEEQQKHRQFYKILIDYQKYFHTQMWRQFDQSTFHLFSVVAKDDSDRIRIVGCVGRMMGEDGGGRIEGKGLGLEGRVQRGVASMVGLGVCDALASPAQFLQFSKSRTDLIGHDFTTIKQQIKNKVLPPVQHKLTLWTDDTSMALCLLDSLYINNSQFKPKHFRYMLHIWKQHGLNNGGRIKTHGITQNVLSSISQFCIKQTDYPQTKKQQKISIGIDVDDIGEQDKQRNVGNNGNQGLSRIAPVVLCFEKQQEVVEIAGLQCKVTNGGAQAVDCCKLLGLILVRLVNRKEGDDWRSVVEQACTLFSNLPRICPSVIFLALSKRQNIDLHEKQLKQQGKNYRIQNKTLQDRNWNWKSQNFNYSKHRIHNQQKNVGSYCMDALSMALHIVWFSSCFKEISIKCANMGGNCCTVGAVAGQMGGAIYGLEQYMMDIYQQMQDAKSGRFQLLIRPYKLITHPPV